MERINTKKIKVGNVQIGAQNKVVIQSMCNTKTKNVKATVEQILELQQSSIEKIRVRRMIKGCKLSMEEIAKYAGLPIDVVEELAESK